ncbi:MAG TPA: zinc ribbon domain-containing protein [Actinomycetes bacterium]|nr:zinc ribbon domain-containing protein [Actinomycetes bacterium]
MPAYDYHCRTCDTSFEVRRGVTDTAMSTPCPRGHEDTTRVFTAIALGGRAGSPASGRDAAPPNPGAGCCGGGCCG